MRMKKLAVLAMAAALSVGTVMTASAAWLQEGSNWRYQNDDGSFQAGTWFRDVDGRWYHFDNNGVMQKGWFLDTDGKWYFLAYNGVMQVGLLKVDNQVYYMNPSGDLFLGDMAVNGTTYNFGLYGTTNGQPSVPATATYGGNGNQSLPSGGSGSSSSGGGSVTTPVPEEVGEAVGNVKNDAEIIKEEVKAVISDIVVPDVPTMNGEDKATVAVVVEVKEIKNDEDITVVKDAVTALASTATENVDPERFVTVEIPAGISIPGLPTHKKEIKAADFDAEMNRLLDKYLNVTNYENHKTGTVASITVPVGEDDVTYVTYTITLK